MRQKTFHIIVNAMSAKRAVVYAIACSLIYFCFSPQLLAFQRMQPPAEQHNYGVDVAALSRLYAKPADYLWLEQQQLTARGMQALEFIARSISHGLNPNDYHQDLLEQLDPANDSTNAHLFDLMLSDGLLKLIRDISTGRLDPAIVDPKWSIPRRQFDAVGYLRKALAGNHFKEQLLSLEPSNDQYRQLEAAAERYQDYVDRGGWPKVTLLNTVHPGDSSEIIPAVRNRLSFEDETVNSIRPVNLDVYDETLQLAVRDFQRRHSLKADGIIGPATVRAMNVPASARLQQIKVNMERLRWLPDNLGDRYIMVNLANYQLTAIEDQQVKLNMRVIVGKKKRSTPSFSGKITHVVFNPRWNVPNKLARLDLLPKQKANPHYLASNNFRVFANQSGKKIEVDPDSIDWHSLSSDQYFPYFLRQEPGEKNALGRVKFVIPNPWAIYLHDTPSKSLFNHEQRTFSAGCIRVEDPVALANFSLTSNIRQSLAELLDNKGEYKTKLEQPVTVYAVYSTVWFDGDELTFSPDNYKRDQKMAKFL